MSPSTNDLLEPVDPATSSTTSLRSTSSVRPRARRLVSFVSDDEEDLGGQGNGSHAAPAFAGVTPPLSRDRTPSPFASRNGSPQVSKDPRNRTDTGYRDSLRPTERMEFMRDNAIRNTSDFLNTSWSSIQSFASSVFGTENPWGNTHGPASKSRRKPSRTDIPIRAPRRTDSPSWGPSTPSAPKPGSGTKEERQALVQAKKREVLLLADGDSVSNLKGRHKRRDSSDRTDEIADPDKDEDALVYVHRVQPTDTMTGVTIKYGCNPAVFRKANGFWPNDSIQMRKTVLLPADACTVKGRRIESENGPDLLGDDATANTNGDHIPPTEARSQEDSGSKEDGDRIWKHEAWVQIDGFPEPVEIGRVPRRTLGFFSRARRKSVSYTDAEPSDSTRPSTDTQRLSSEPSTHPRSLPQSATASPSRAADSRRGHRRTGSNIRLEGPGGVGTLGRNATTPGPATDSLSKSFSQHLSTLTAPQVPSNLRKTSFDSTSTAMSGTSTNGLENVGGAIESWMRKMASRAKSGLSELQQGTASFASQRQQGDLIELDDSFEPNTSSPRRPARHDHRGGPVDHSRLSTRAQQHSGYSSPSTSRARQGRTSPRPKDD